MKKLTKKEITKLNRETEKILVMFGDMLKERRTLLGISQAKLYKETKLSPKTISKIESGSMSLKMEQLIKYCSYLNKNVLDSYLTYEHPKTKEFPLGLFYCFGLAFKNIEVFIASHNITRCELEKVLGYYPGSFKDIESKGTSHLFKYFKAIIYLGWEINIISKWR